MFAGSSRPTRSQNPDGSWNTYCYMCQRYIARSVVRAPRALCYICQKSEEGQPLTAEQIRDYEMSKLERGEVGMLNLVEPENPMPNQAKRKFSFDNIAGPVLRALGVFGLAQQGNKQKEKQATVPSAIIAREKRRPRLFSKGQLTEDKK